MDDLAVGRFTIPDEEITETFTTSGGPGGQHANRSQTAVEIRFDVAASTAFPEIEQHRIIDRLGAVVTVTASDSRSQWRNRALARERLAERLAQALRPVTPRRPTKPSRASRVSRLESKRQHSEKKRLRRRPDW
ncbi:MAG TPA: alternative ribosome rescue aminoacyl-tRNA hydrolase ArfB [Acidimicrobiia bacterium]|jgi:ribosome-associated protein|nr:alternative ribosome rescue aminoacyl-tRNA hydrolase ArfB [Acidimicrobiia bacterium]